jgi:hypothetical protein
MSACGAIWRALAWPNLNFAHELEQLNDVEFFPPHEP